MHKDHFARMYGFYSYEEMLSESGKRQDQNGTVWFVTPLAVDWIVWADSFPEPPQVYTFEIFEDAINHIETYSRGKTVEKDKLSNLIEDYTGKINRTDEPGLKRAYEASREMLQILKRTAKNCR